MGIYFTLLAALVASLLMLVILGVLFSNAQLFVPKLILGGMWLWCLWHFLASAVGLMGLTHTVILVCTFVLFVILQLISSKFRNIILRAILRVLIYFLLFVFFTMFLMFLFTDLP